VTIWTNLVVVHIFLALGLLMSIPAMRANWAAMFTFLFLLRATRVFDLIHCDLVIYGLLLSLVSLATSIIR
jgi:hypothetical protein